MKEQKNDRSCYPLSNSQLNIWRLEQSFQGTSINNICETIRIQGTFDIALVQKCLNTVLESDCTLRTRITLDENQHPVQYETTYHPVSFPVFDFSTTNRNGLWHWEDSITREVMPVLNAPLFYFAIVKIGEHEGGILVKTHHLISDGWSQVSLINRIAQTYLALLNGEESKLKPAPSYRIHVEEEQAYLASRAYRKDEAFWKKILKEIPYPVSIKDSSGLELSPVGQRKSFRLTELLNHALSSFCTSHRVAPFAVFYMALAIYLKRVKNAGRICIGAPIHNRSTVDERKMTGMFVSTLPFFCELDENWSFEEFNDYLTENWLDLLRHQKYPYGEILALAREENPGTTRLFHLVLSFHNSHAYHNQDTSVAFSGQWHYAGYQAEHLCIHLNNIEDERRFSVNYDYLTQLFSKYEIEDFHHYLVNILTQALAFPQKPIRELSILGAEEEEKVIYTFNQTYHCSLHENLCQKLETVCKNYPQRAAVIWRGERYSYEVLWKRAETVAAEIFRRGGRADSVFSVLLPKSFELLAVLAGVIRSGCAWLILSPSLPGERMRDILSESQAEGIFTSREYRKVLPDENTAPVLLLEELRTVWEPVSPCQAGPGSLAYLAYTSGSTGKPKGVEIEQHSLLNFAEGCRFLYGGGAVLSLCSISFDAFLLESVVSLLNGQTVVLPEEGETENPARIGALIRQYAVGFLALTPSRLAAYLKNPEFLRAAGRLDAILCGGEAFPGSLLNTLKRSTHARIYNQYGPTETTVGVSTALLNGASHITVGRPMPGCRLYVLDRHQKPLPIGMFGELYVGGSCVGRGYRGEPVLTAEAFLENPFEPGERIYRTGDLAAWTEEGEILLKGREDGQVKLRGQRLELEEIRARLLMHPRIRQAAVCLRNLEGQQVLAGYYVSQEPLEERELLEFSALYLPEYMIPSVFIAMQEIPLTANGKIDYAALPDPVRKQAFGSVQTESSVTGQILDIFRRNLNKPQMGQEDDYFLWGGDSLNALETLSDLEESFGIRLRVADLYACRTAGRLALHFGEQEVRAVPEEIPRAEKQESYPLTPAQMGIYFETQMEPDSLTYNMPCAFSISGRLDSRRLFQAVRKLTEEEPILRTVFTAGKDGIRQKVLDTVTPSFEEYSVSLEEARDTFVRPFSLREGPLFRLGLWQGKEKSVLFMDLHHIVGDAVTALLLLKRLNCLYEEKDPESPPVTFPDYACWFAANQEQILKNQRPYWKEQLQELPPLAEIPTDYPRGKYFRHDGAQLEAVLSPSDSETCRRFCEKLGITPFVLFAGAFGLFLSRLTGNTKLLVGTPVSARRLPSLTETSGLLVNTLPLRLEPEEGLAAGEYLRKVREQVTGLLDHPDLSMEELVSLSGVKRLPGQNPFYRTMISLRPVETDTLSFDGQPVRPEEVSAKSAKVDLNLEVYRSEGRYHLRLEYAAGLFEKETAALYIRGIKTTVQELIQGENRSLGSCRTTDLSDWYRLVERPRSLRMPFVDLPIDEQIDMMARMMDDKPGVIFHREETSFAELKNRSDALAGSLIQEGVRPGDPVGLLCRRGPQLLIGLLGILKAGGAYVPMLPDFPENRLKEMARISGLRLTLCGPGTPERIPEEMPGRVLDLEAACAAKVSFVKPEGRSGEDPCFVLFTSGSTGAPKGVMVRHRSVSNLLAVLAGEMADLDGAVLCTTNFIFDIFLTESLAALAFGKCVVMADEEEMLLPWKAARLVREHHAEMFQFTPSRASLFMDNPDFFQAVSGISLAATAGEALDQKLVEKFRTAGCKKILNLYGPTEATVYVTMADVTDARRITIGKVFPNCRGYVLDEKQRPVMPTALGELYLAGECLAAGYVNREDLTSEMFVPDPFVPGQRMYRSGDLVRLLANGQIDYVGRRDHQIKLNGQRVELDEITKKILSSGLAAQAATIVIKNETVTKLRAFVDAREGEQLEAGQLRAYLEQELPAYMVPSEIVVLPKLPCTASGKIDRKALEAYEGKEECAVPTIGEPAQSARQEERMEEPLREPEETAAPAQSTTEDQTVDTRAEDQAPTALPAMTDLEALWKEALGSDAIDPDTSFFDQGGTSFGALVLLGGYYNLGLVMSLTEFYEYPTLKAQAGFFHIPADDCRTAEEKKAESPSLPETEEPAAVPAAKTDFQTVPTPKKEKRPVLLTGATGFFGAHLAKELLDQGYPKIYCLIRGANPERLPDTLAWYFGNGWLYGNQKRLIAVSGDILDEKLGLDDTAARTIQKEIGSVIHAAADVRHYASDQEAELTNVRGTAHAAAFAREAGARLIHISTVSLCGEYLPNAPQETAEFSEQDFEIGQNWMDSVYLRGKYAAEQQVRQEAENGLDAVIMRIGRLVGRNSDGIFQKNPETNAFCAMVRGITCLEKISGELADMPMEMTAVDTCARAVVSLMESQERVFHIFNPYPLTIRQILCELHHPLKEVDREEFEAHLRSLTRCGHGPQISMLLSQYNRFRQVPPRVFPVCRETVKCLEAMGFSWEVPDAAKLLKCFLPED